LQLKEGDSIFYGLWMLRKEELVIDIKKSVETKES
jgi:hypothetical protein